MSILDIPMMQHDCMTMKLTCLSAQCDDGRRIYAIVPGEAPLQRLKNDDPIWKGWNVYQHWVHFVPEKCRVRPANRIKFKMGA